MTFRRLGAPGAEIPTITHDGRVYDLRPLTADLDGAFLASDGLARARAAAAGGDADLGVLALHVRGGGAAQLLDDVQRFPQGGEPVLTPDGARITDRRGRPSFVTSAGAGPSLGTYLLMAYLPPWYAVEGTGLLVEYLGERYPVTVARAGLTPLFDPDDTRMR